MLILPTAKYDPQGKLITSDRELLNLYKETYKNRLKHRKMKPGNESIQYLHHVLLNLRINVAKLRKSDPWSADQLFKVLKSLKNNKCADPLSMTYELFKPGIIGGNLFNSLLMFCNETKEKVKVIEALKLSDITSIYKNKGSRLSLDSERGIFSVVKVRSIIDKLLYQDIYPIIEEQMSDSNVGARRERNIRDNLFVVYAVMGDALDTGVDLEVVLYDVAKCFDSMWWECTSNDLRNKNMCNDKFALICALYEQCNVSNKTPAGQTERFLLNK